MRFSDLSATQRAIIKVWCVIVFAVTLFITNQFFSDEPEGPRPAAYGRPFGGSEVVSLQDTVFYRRHGEPSEETLAAVRARLASASTDWDTLDVLAMEACAIEQTYFDRHQPPPPEALDLLTAYEEVDQAIRSRPIDSTLDFYEGALPTLRELEDEVCQHASGALL